MSLVLFTGFAARLYRLRWETSSWHAVSSVHAEGTGR